MYMCRYRLAPDNKFPVPMEDCTDATIYFLQNAQQFDVDPNRIAVMGNNGHFSLFISSDCKCRGQPPIPLQCNLTYSISSYPKAWLHPGLEIMSPIPLFIASLYLFRPYKEMTPTPKSDRKLSSQ